MTVQTPQNVLDQADKDCALMQVHKYTCDQYLEDRGLHMAKKSQCNYSMPSQKQ